MRRSDCGGHDMLSSPRVRSVGVTGVCVLARREERGERREERGERREERVSGERHLLSYPPITLS